MFIDAHSHLDLYGEDLESVLEEINQHRIATVSNSMDLPSYERNLQIAENGNLILPIFGVHPWNASGHADCLESLGEAIDRSPMFGEIGLDHHFVRDASQYAAQTKLFEFFLAAASEQDKLVILHSWGAEKEVLNLLRSYDIHRAIIHWYSGPLDVFQSMVEYRLHFSIGVEVLYSQHVQRIAQDLPSELLLTETDNPGGLQLLADIPGRPILINQIIQKVADIRQVSPQVIIDTVHANFLRLINDDRWIPDSYAKLLIE